MTEKQHATTGSPVQVWEPNTRSGPIRHERTRRTDAVSVVTSSFAGKFVPLKMIPLLREDAVLNSRLTLNVQMAETADMLLNPVRISGAAYFVPKLAFERFADMGTIDRSYNGQQEIDGTTVPWFEPYDPPAIDNPSELQRALGLHMAPGGNYNSDYWNAYNVLHNYILANRSSAVTPRGENNKTLAPAFWRHTQMKHVVPNFDDAMIEGTVPLSMASQELPVLGIGTSFTPAFEQSGIRQTGDTSDGGNQSVTPVQGLSTTRLLEDPNNPGYPGVFAQLQESGITVSLATIDQARETAAWARLRTQYQGKSEDWMIDQLLQGIRLNDDQLKQPILLDAQDVFVGMSQRYATDSGNLSKSVVDGRTALQLNLRVPQTQCGGIVVVVAQALPEMLYERQVDYYLAAQTVSQLPQRTADELDPQPVAMVANGEIDVQHTAPADLFGYAPLNHHWQRKAPNVGGKYFKPDPQQAWTENRNRIWDTGVVDPRLGQDFYVSQTLQHEVFESSNEDPFEWWLSGNVNIEGLTYFGPMLRESVDDYEKVQAQIPQGRLKGDGTDDPAVPPAGMLPPT